MPWWKYALAPFLGLLAFPLLILWALIILLPCELMWIGLTLIGREDKGDVFMEFAIGMLP